MEHWPSLSLSKLVFLLNIRNIASFLRTKGASFFGMIHALNLPKSFLYCLPSVRGCVYFFTSMYSLASSLCPFSQFYLLTKVLRLGYDHMTPYLLQKGRLQFLWKKWTLQCLGMEPVIRYWSNVNFINVPNSSFHVNFGHFRHRNFPCTM